LAAWPGFRLSPSADQRGARALRSRNAFRWCNCSAVTMRRRSWSVFIRHRARLSGGQRARVSFGGLSRVANAVWFRNPVRQSRKRPKHIRASWLAVRKTIFALGLFCIRRAAALIPSKTGIDMSKTTSRFSWAAASYASWPLCRAATTSNRDANVEARLLEYRWVIMGY
jgi:hypothetical protein